MWNRCGVSWQFKASPHQSVRPAWQLIVERSIRHFALMVALASPSFGYAASRWVQPEKESALPATTKHALVNYCSFQEDVSSLGLGILFIPVARDNTKRLSISAEFTIGSNHSYVSPPRRSSDLFDLRLRKIEDMHECIFKPSHDSWALAVVPDFQADIGIVPDAIRIGLSRFLVAGSLRPGITAGVGKFADEQIWTFQTSKGLFRDFCLPVADLALPLSDVGLTFVDGSLLPTKFELAFSETGLPTRNTNQEDRSKHSRNSRSSLNPSWPIKALSIIGIIASWVGGWISGLPSFSERLEQQSSSVSGGGSSSQI